MAWPSNASSLENDCSGAGSSAVRSDLFAGAGTCATLVAGASASSVQHNNRRGDVLSQHASRFAGCISTEQHDDSICAGIAGISVCSTLAASTRMNVILRRRTASDPII